MVFGRGSLEGLVAASGTSGDGAFADAFGGRRVLVTGHTGFKGSWLTIWLRRLGAEVVGYSLPAPTTPSNYELSQVRDLLVREHVADVRDRERLAGVVAQERPEVIFHLAAQSLVREGYAQPFEAFAVNVMGVVGLLEAPAGPAWSSW